MFAFYYFLTQDQIVCPNLKHFHNSKQRVNAQNRLSSKSRIEYTEKLHLITPSVVSRNAFADEKNVRCRARNKHELKSERGT